MATSCIISIVSSAIFVISLSTFTLQTTINDNYYIAAVVDYNGIYDSEQNATVNALNNANKFAAIINKTAEYLVDIIVFPELGILAFDKTLYFKVPDPKDKVIPAKSSEYHEVLRKISQAAADSEVYVLINLLEEFKNNGKIYKYNTNVVFDRTGAVIARYRKYNLFREDFLDRPDKPEYVYFKTDFGVTFGTVICFDLLFKEPTLGLVRDYNISDILFSTAWFSELPFHIAIQEQYAWAYGTNTNLLASGYLNTSSGNTGSGIYAGKLGSIVSTESESNGTKILIGHVPKKSSKPDAAQVVLNRGEIISFEESKPHSVPIVSQDLTPFITKLIKPETLTPIKTEQIMQVPNTVEPVKGLQKQYSLEERLCDGKFCCNFSLTFNVDYYSDNYNLTNDLSYKKSDAFYHFNYRLIAFDGIRTHFHDTTGEQICALMPCLNYDLYSCAKPNHNFNFTNLNYINDKDLGKLFRYSTNFIKINITGDFYNSGVFIKPSILASSETTSETFGKLIEPNQFQFNIKNSTHSTAQVSLVISTDKFATGGISVRVFGRDNIHQNTSNVITAHSLLAYAIVILIYFISLK